MAKGILIALVLSVAIVAFGWLAFSIFDKKRWWDNVPSVGR